MDLDNVEKWIRNACVAVGVGDNLAAPAKTGEFDRITEYAKQYIEKVKTARRL